MLEIVKTVFQLGQCAIIAVIIFVVLESVAVLMYAYKTEKYPDGYKKNLLDEISLQTLKYLKSKGKEKHGHER